MDRDTIPSLAAISTREPLANDVVLRVDGHAPPPRAWLSLLAALEHWPSPAEVHVERRLSRVGHHPFEHIVVGSDASGLLDADRDELLSLVRPLSASAGLRPDRVVPHRRGASVHVGSIGRKPSRPDDDRLSDLVDELRRLPEGAGLSIRVRSTFRRGGSEDDEPRLRLGTVAGFTLELLPAQHAGIDAEVELWSPTGIRSSLVAKFGAAFEGSTSPVPVPRVEKVDVLVPARLAALLAAPGLHSREASSVRRLGLALRGTRRRRSTTS